MLLYVLALGLYLLRPPPSFHIFEYITHSIQLSLFLFSPPALPAKLLRAFSAYPTTFLTFLGLAVSPRRPPPSSLVRSFLSIFPAQSPAQLHHFTLPAIPKTSAILSSPIAHKYCQPAYLLSTYHLPRSTATQVSPPPSLAQPPLFSPLFTLPIQPIQVRTSASFSPSQSLLIQHLQSQIRPSCSCEPPLGPRSFIR
jgi:hypothetical protein